MAALRTVSNRGAAIEEPSPGQLAPLRKFNGRDLHVLGRRGGIWIYAFQNRPGPLNCFGDGTATSFGETQTVGIPSGVFSCQPSFPGSQSVLDFSEHTPCSTAYSLVAGVASDGVATVSALDASGRVVAKTNVAGNVYIIDGGALQTRRAVKLIARDTAGKIVFRSPGAAEGGCTPGSTAGV